MEGPGQESRDFVPQSIERSLPQQRSFSTRIDEVNTNNEIRE